MEEREFPVWLSRLRARVVSMRTQVRSLALLRQNKQNKTMEEQTKNL